MKPIKWIKENAFWIWIPVLIFSLILASVYFTWNDRQNDKEVVVEGKIISVEYLGTAKGYWRGDALRLTFDNEESYEIVIWEDVDFTVNSKMIMKLFWDGDDDYWEIVRMYKVPSED